MPAPNDLTWNQLQLGFSELGIHNIISGTTVNGIYRINLDLSQVVNVNNISDPGVVKFVAKLLDACRIAQERINIDENGSLKPAGERLDAFPAPVTGAIASGQVPVTKSVKTRSDLFSVTRITGATA